MGSSDVDEGASCPSWSLWTASAEVLHARNIMKRFLDLSQFSDRCLCTEFLNTKCVMSVHLKETNSCRGKLDSYHGADGCRNNGVGIRWLVWAHKA
mmetsp:Transcript_101802/g.270865  ORF Transcript_101802/g.270865 Transcript_101802/m.270865 type:complete len:96 (+) Transcript_101802:1587-1874(+)